MTPVDDTRGQAIQVGASLLFAFVVIALAMYQASVVPQENKEVEFNSYQEASGDLIELRNGVITAANHDVQTGTTIETGTNYPARALFVNPGPAMGQISTTSSRNVTFTNVTAANGSLQNAQAYWDGTGRNFTTQTVTFRPRYSEFSASPTVITGNTAYRDFDDGISPIAGQSFLQGNRITVVTIEGDLNAGGVTASVTADPISAHGRTVTVTGEGENFNVTLPVAESSNEWLDSAMADEIRANPNVESVARNGSNAVDVTFNGSRNYELRLARVGVREQSTATIGETSPRYIVTAVDRQLETDADQRARLVVEARDRYDNPVSDAQVTFNASDGQFEDEEGTVRSTTVRTDDEGRAVIWYNASGTFGQHTVDAYLGDSANDSLPEEQRLTYVVTNAGGDGGDTSSFILSEGATGTDGSDTVTFQLNNTGSSAINVTGVRMDYVTQYTTTGEFKDGPTQIRQVSLDSQTRNNGVAEENGAPWFFEDEGEMPLNMTADGSVSLSMTFDENYSLGNKEVVPISITVYYEGGLTATYTVWLGV